MGSCVSKCYPIPPKNDPSSVVMQDKLVISESPPLTKSLPPDLPSMQTTSSSSSSSSSTCSLLSAASPAISSSTTSTSSSSSATISPLPFSFSRAKSTARENPRIVVLDPQKLGVVMKHEPAAKPPSLRVLQPTNKWKQSMARSRSSQVLAAKRARSSPPSLVPRRRISGPVSRSAVAFPSRSSSSSSTPQRIRKQRPEVGIAGNLVVPPPVTPRKQQTLQSCSPCHQTSSFKIRETNLHYIRQNLEESSEDSSGVAVGEELSNPLICMECFIFL